MTKKQFIVAISIVSALVIAAVAVFLIVFNRPVAENNVVSTVELSTQEITDLEILSSTFLQEASNFGVNMDTLTAETVSQRMEDIANDNGGTSWTKRSEVAGRLVSEYMDLSGGFSFAPDRISNADYADGSQVASFRGDQMDVSVAETAGYVYTNRDEPVLLAEVKFSGSSTLSHFAQSPDAIHDHELSEDHDAEFTPWDISEQTVSVSGTLTLSQDEEGGAWRIRDVEFDAGEFAMPFWKPEAFTTSYPGIELGGTVVRSLDFPNQKENTDGQG